MRFKLWLEQNGSDKKELYHATLSGPNNEIVNSFIKNGINPSMAKGFKQGAGFYMFTNKEIAINHAKTLGENQGKGDSQDSQEFRLGGFVKEMPVQGNPIIVVSDEPITPECFDIDYEIYGHAFARFFHDNEEYFRKNADKLNLHLQKKSTKEKRLSGSFDPDKLPSAPYGGSVVFPGFANEDDLAYMTFSPDEGGAVSKFAEKLAQFDPHMFNKFESEYLHLAPAIKFNCKKTIWPSRIESIDGSVIWKRAD